MSGMTHCSEFGPGAEFAQRIMLHQMSSSWPISNLLKSLHLLEELERYTTPGFFLHDCNFNELVDLAKRTYLAFGSTHSTHMALSEDKRDAVRYFSHYLNLQIDTYFWWFDVLQAHNDGPGTSGEPRDADEREEDDNDNGCSNDNGIGITHLANLDLLFGEDRPTLAPQEQTCGDMLKYNSTILWRNLLHYWEMKQSVKEGNIGHLFEINKVGHLLTCILELIGFIVPPHMVLWGQC